jgi:lipid II isoglutaminyl synthase (glutamine-hydrolysing)
VSSSLTIEVLFPEIANLHGDTANMSYLAQCRPDARVVRTGLTDTPAFVTEHVDLVYLGPLTEHGQLKAIERLLPHRDRIEALIEAGTAFLFTHNALEVLGTRVRNDDMGYDVAGVGIFELESTVRMFDRYNGKVMGTVPEVGSEFPILGYKSQFSMVSPRVSDGFSDKDAAAVSAELALPGFLTADRGIGRNAGTAIEGVRRDNFIGTSLLGPILIVNPYFTRALLELLDPHSEPTLAHETLAVTAYQARLGDFRDPRRWHRFERLQSKPATSPVSRKEPTG